MTSSNIMTPTTATESLKRSESVSVLSETIKYTYIFLTMIAALSVFDGIPTAMKLAHFPVMGICALMLCAKPKAHFWTASSYLIEYSAYVLVMIALTSIIYALDIAPMSLMKRGYEKLFFQMLTIFVAVSAYYLFEKKAMLYTFYGFALFNAVSVLLALQRTGPAAAIKDFIYFMTSGGDAVGFMKYLELHDGTFSFGVFLVYFMVAGVKKYKVQTLISALFFSIGFKRIGIIAIIGVIPIYFLLRNKDMKKLKQIGKWTGIMFIFLGVTFILCTYFRLFEIAMNLMGVNTMGRNELYEFVRDYYEISPLYMGHGFEYITQLMKTATYGTLNMAKIGAIHNGYLTVYIELGFVGFFIWCAFWLVWHMKWQAKFGREALLAYICVTIYLYTTYFTDNTAFYYLTGTCAKILPMVLSNHTKSY